MRLLQLATGPDELLDLHPHVTVVAGLDERGHRVLLEAVAGLARSEAGSAGGLLEAHGVLFDFEEAALGVLDLRVDGLDPIVRPKQLPGRLLSVDERELQRREQEFARLLEQVAERVERQAQARSAVATATNALGKARAARADAGAGEAHRAEERARLVERLERLDVQTTELGDLVAAARPALDLATAARADVESRTEAVRAARDAAEARVAALEAELDALQAAVDPFAAIEVEEATAALRTLEAELEVERAEEAARLAEVAAAEASSVHAEPLEPAAVRLERAEAREAELDQLLVVLDPVEEHEVREALALLQGSADIELVPSAEAAALAEALDRVDAELAAMAAEEVDADVVAAARHRLDDARHAVLEAEQAARSPVVDPSLALRLEDVHDEIGEALDRAERRFAKASAAERVAELRQAEQELLDELGFASFADYVMGHSLHQRDPALDAALERARAELTAAEEGWKAIEATTEAALGRAAALDRRRGLVGEARSLLDAPPGPRPQDALRALRVPAVSTIHAAERLRSALVAAGLDLGDEELDHEELVLVAEVWLHEADQVDDRIRAAVEERAALRDALPALREEAAAEAAAPPPEEEVDQEAARTARLDDARARLKAAEDRWLQGELALERSEALVGELETARVLAAAAVEEAAGGDAELREARDRETERRQEVRAREEELAAAMREAEEIAPLIDALDRPAPDARTLDAAVREAEERLTAAQDLLEVEDRAVAALDSEGRAQALEIERLQDIVAAESSGEATQAEELEWYLLARLAAQRAVSVAGSLPLLLDDALRGLDPTEVDHLLGRLERMADAVQVIVVSDDPVVASWATTAGPARAAVVRPTAA